MSESPYSDGEVVWVKWGSCWWPGEVWENSRVPSEVITALRKPVIAFVKFFQEDAYEFVRSPNNIMKYGCDKKLDYIKKGMDKYRTNSKVMVNFPADVIKAEQLTNGNVNILSNLGTPMKSKAAEVVATPEKSSTETTPVAVPKKSAATYNSSSKVQTSASPAPKSEKKFTCTLCDYTTERMNLLMFHIKNHSSKPVQRASDVSSVVIKKASAARSPVKKALDPNDSIADDVRKIKESMKKEPKVTPAKKSREPAKSTPSGRASRSKKEEKEVVKVEPVKVPEKLNPEPVNELKNELLADWSDDDDVTEKVEERPKSPPPKPAPAPEKIGESSRFIRNIPKKQRVSEIYIKSEPEKVVQPIIEARKSAPKESSKKLDDSVDDLKTPDVVKKTPKASKRKHTTSEQASEEDSKKLPDETDDSLLLATAELLNDTEVPKMENAQPSSTFHKSNDIDKRNLPPKERNKRLFKAKISRESPPEANVSNLKTDNNGSMTKEAESPIVSPIQNELMLPHKKKQSSRLLTAEKPSPVLETRTSRETKQEPPATESRTRKKRKSSEVKIADQPVDVETNSHEAQTVGKQDAVQSPLREAVDVNAETISSELAASATSNSISNHRRGLKRRISDDSHQLIAEDSKICSEPKKLHRAEAETQPKTIVVACATETICISSKGQLSVARRDSVVTTQANSVMVTSQVIISEATHQPIVSTTPSHATVQTTNSYLSMTVKPPLTGDIIAVKFPPKNMIDLKKQGLVMKGNDNKNKFTKKGKQIFKEIKEKTAEATLEETENVSLEPEQTATLEPAKQTVENLPEEVEYTETCSQGQAQEADDTIVAQAGEEAPGIRETPEVESNGAPALDVDIDESTNNNDIAKEPIASDDSPSKEQVEQEPVENGKEAEGEEAAAEDPNSGGAGLIALQAETFGGPTNCFYLCRQIDDRYQPVDNQILVLNAQNALVPYDGEVVSEDSLAPTEVVTENLTGYPQLSPNSNIIINTPNGQKIELDHFAIMALQEQADENGIASIEMAGEQLELNINGILEAITAQQEANDGDNLISGAVLIDGDGALILDTSEMPVEMHHSATQVSETLSKPIMSTTVAPEISSTKTTLADSMSSKSLNIEDSLASIGVTTPSVRSNVPKSLELPITITNPAIAETVNHRKLANAPITPGLGELLDVVAVEAESFVVQSPGNGSQD